MHVYDAQMRKIGKAEEPTEYLRVVACHSCQRLPAERLSALEPSSSDSSNRQLVQPDFQPQQEGALPLGVADLDTFLFLYSHFLIPLTVFASLNAAADNLLDCQNPNSHCPWTAISLAKFECFWVSCTVSSL